MSNYLKNQSLWCEAHWTNIIWPKIVSGEVIGLSLTMDLNASIFNSEQFKEFRKQFSDEQTAIDQFIERYSPLCCLLEKGGLDQLIAANTPEMLRKRRPKVYREIMAQEREARKRAIQK